MKTRSEYEHDNVPESAAAKVVERARCCAAISHRADTRRLRRHSERPLRTLADRDLAYRSPKTEASPSSMPHISSWVRWPARSPGRRASTAPICSTRTPGGLTDYHCLGSKRCSSHSPGRRCHKHRRPRQEFVGLNSLRLRHDHNPGRRPNWRVESAAACSRPRSSVRPYGVLSFSQPPLALNW
jgi:hypothetical protein